jgi:peptidoglycan/xylan/chitin deacetylase (PgdA/CDA1 family)
MRRAALRCLRNLDPAGSCGISVKVVLIKLGGKRELLARALFWSGTAAVLRALRESDVLLVLNYHRIGDANADAFDPGVFSATAERFEEQVAFLNRHKWLVTLDEALAFLDGSDRSRARRCRVLITFDDGYLDNYQLAFPILRAHGAQGVFFLPTGLVGSCAIPWWDHIAFLIRTGTRRRFTLRREGPLDVDLDANGLTRSLYAVLAHYKKHDIADAGEFFHELREATGASDPPPGLRRFLDWEEARAMLQGGMAIGSHTCSHTILSHLDADAQMRELSASREQIKERLGIEATTIAYPVGGASCFTSETERMARDCGYRAAFSFYGGVSRPPITNRYDVKREGVGDQSWERFRVQASMCAATGRYWP